MATVIWLSIILINLALTLLHKNNKIIVLLSVIAIIMLMGGNYQNADFSGYNRFYNAQVYPASMELGYVWLSSIFHSIGFTYQNFVLVIMIIAIALASVVVIKFQADIHLVIALYMSTLFFLDAVQIRQMMAYALFAVALMLFAHEKRLFGILAILLAFLFQWTAIVFMPIAFINPKKRLNNRAIKIIVTLILVSCVFIFINGNSLSFFMPIIRAIVNSDKLVYFDTRTRFGFILYFAFQFMCMYIAYICKTNVEKTSDSKELIAFAQYTYMATMYACIALPLVMINNNFSRIFKYSMLSCLILISHVYKENRGRGFTIQLTNKIVTNAPTFSAVLVAYVVVYEIAIQLSTVVSDVLSYNIYF